MLKARMDDTKSALEGIKMDANTYPETDDLHFEWLDGWAQVHMERVQTLTKANTPAKESPNRNGG